MSSHFPALYDENSLRNWMLILCQRLLKAGVSADYGIIF